MKRCPECRRDYYDETLLYCLDDGTPLLAGPATDASTTVMLPAREEPSEAQTRAVPVTDQPPDKQTHQEATPIRKPITQWAAIVLVVLVLFAVVGFAVFR